MLVRALHYKAHVNGIRAISLSPAVATDMEAAIRRIRISRVTKSD